MEYCYRDELFREAVLAFLGVKTPEKEVPTEEKKVGWYCSGKDVDECSKMFGVALSKVCQTCPN